MRAAEIRRMSAAWQRGFRDGNDYRANAQLAGDNVRQTAGINARANFDNPDSRLDYALGFERACGVR